MATITAQHKAIERYYAELASIHGHGATHEQATRAAFEHLLSALAKPQADWQLILEQRLPNGRIPDGTFRDPFNIRCGYWEAKDTADDLDAEIKKKIAAGYPTANTIFEDTRRAVLYQGNRVTLDVQLAKPHDLAYLLNTFFGYREPHKETFDAAVQEFKARIPELAEDLLGLIVKQEAENATFREALGKFLELCRSSLDPNIGLEAVREMLVQHLLTERLFRTVFNNPDFTRRNVIAAEIETVIDALTSHAFNRAEFLRSLDRFYLAIENEARDLTDWAEKQHFMNVVYERFFQGWSRKTADTHGIVYTPQEIVDFMCASVEEVLQREFGRSLSDRGVQILDPATGTGSFVVNLLRRISGANLAYKYSHDLFANEIMLLPYYIAALNIEHEYYDKAPNYQAFEGLCFADTLELADPVAHRGVRQPTLGGMERNAERVESEQRAQIMVVIGNPPYNMGQQNENDNNQNRKYPVIDARIADTYVKDSTATLRNKLYDAYVRFFRWATDRLQSRDGVVCLVTNNSFVHKITFDGMRKHLLQDFTQVYHLDLGGDMREGEGGNVFGITVGVGITIAVRAINSEHHGLYYYRVPDGWRREEKLRYLLDSGSFWRIPWQQINPDERNTWLTEGLHAEFATFLPVGTKEAKAAESAAVRTIFKTYSLGVATNRDSLVYSFDVDKLRRQVDSFVEIYSQTLDRYKRLGGDLDSLIDTNDQRIKWTRQVKASLARLQSTSVNQGHFRNALYRPFTRKHLYFDEFWNEERYQQPSYFPTPQSEAENVVLIVSDHGHRSPFSSLASSLIPELHLLASTDGFQCFPLYTYDEDGSNRRENITDWALARFQEAYGPHVTRRDIFAYVYAILHHPAYRERYAENLKRELPHIPLLPATPSAAPSLSSVPSVSSAVNPNPFATCVRIGNALLDLHLTYEQAPEYPLVMRETPGERTDWRVKKMKLTADKTALVYNGWLALEGIPPAVSRYRLGNRSALEWIVDQYQVSTDARSGITSDPNRADDPEYIVRLIKQVVTVSVETVRLVDELAASVDLLAAVGVATEVTA
jgi:predicted helicase